VLSSICRNFYIMIKNKIIFYSFFVACFAHLVGASHELTKDQAYKILGLNKVDERSQADITKKYRLLARKYHPDKNKDPKAEDQFKKINAAYGVLHREQSENTIKLASGLSFEQMFHIQGLVRNINSLIQQEKAKNYFSPDIVEQQLRLDLTEANYKEELRAKIDLLKKVKHQIAEHQAAIGERNQPQESVKVSKDAQRIAQIASVFAELNKEYQARELIPNFEFNPMLYTLDQAKAIYAEKVKLADALKELKEFVQANERYIRQEIIAEYFPGLRSVEDVDSFFNAIKQARDTFAEKRCQEEEKIKSIYEEIQKLKESVGLTGRLPDPSKVTYAWAEEKLEDIKIIADIHKKIVEFTLAQQNIKDRIDLNKDFIPMSVQKSLIDGFTSIDQLTGINKQLNDLLAKNKKKRIQELHDNTIKYQSFARFGLSPEIKSKFENQLTSNLDFFDKKNNDGGIDRQFNTLVETAEQQERKARRARNATVTAGLGLVATVTGLAAHLYYKNK
jgi:DnaJ domain